MSPNSFAEPVAPGGVELRVRRLRRQMNWHAPRQTVRADLMRHVDPSSIISSSTATVHLVLEDFGALGRTYRETDAARADAATIVERMLRGEYSAPAQVIAFNVEQGWVRDVSAQIARALIAKVGLEAMPEHVRRFVERHVVCLVC